MCQLLGVSANREVDIRLSLQEFQHRGKRNSHGWGFAFYENGGWKVIKKPRSLDDEDITWSDFLFQSRVIIGHVRLASCGAQTHENTHPFQRGKWFFAHNGTVRKIKNYKLNKYKPEGETDTEYAFCYLLERIEEVPNQSVEAILKREAEKIQERGVFNFLMSDGEKLYAFGDTSLYYAHRKAPFPSVQLCDDGYEVDLKEIKKEGEEAIIIAPKPLTTEEKWIPIKGLKVFENSREIV